MAHGGSLTINPETGLPEAGFLENILPAVAGFALDAFLPGAGEALGGMFGLEGAAASQVGSALAVGGISGLASGSLEKGIMAGMGAYGGAGLSQSLGNMGAGVNARAVNAEYDTSMPNLTDTERVAAIQAASKPDIGTGFSAAAKAPMDFLKDNKMSLAMLAAPILMDSFGNKDSGPEANPSPGYIRTMKRDPVTGRIYQESAIPTGEFGGRSVGTYGGVPARGMAEGGAVSDSQKAFDYLMGKPGSTNPMTFTEKTTKGPEMPSDYGTRKGGKYILDALTNSYIWVPDADSGISALDKANQERLAAANRGGGGDRGEQTGDGYSAPVSPLSSPMSGGLMYGLVDTYGNILGGALPGGLIAQQVAQAMNPQAVANASAASSAAQQAALNGYTSGKMFGAPPSSPATFGGAGYGIPVGSGGYGVTGQTGAGSIGNPMGIDAATAQGQQAGAAASAQAAANQAMTDAANAQATADAIAAGGASYSSNPDGSLSPTGGFDNSAPGAGYGETASGGIDGSMYSQGGITALAGGGLGSLGGYSDGGQLLRGPGDGVSDSIPARIGRKQPARLADGEFVVPARIVSELGNGSTEAGARQLYKMLDRIQAGRKKTVGKNKTAVNSKSARYLPA
jgi:hypothetical protein